jgi:hypothetical protein
MCTEVWHYPSSSRQTDENRLVATSPAPGSRTRFQPGLKPRWPLYLVLRPNSQTVTEVTVALLVDAPLRSCPKVVCAAEFTEELVCESRGNRFESEDSRLIRRPCRCGEPGGCAVHTNRSWVGCADSEEASTGNTSIAVEKASFSVVERVPPRKREVHAA